MGADEVANHCFTNDSGRAYTRHQYRKDIAIDEIGYRDEQSPVTRGCSRVAPRWFSGQVYEVESADYAAMTFRKAYLREGVAGEDLVLHSDNGSPMKGATMLATLQRLDVMPSFSRPSVSDDNPYSEALFKTLKYCPAFPNKPFVSLDEARQWVAQHSRCGTTRVICTAP